MIWICILLVLLAMPAFFWQWDWFIPIVQSRATAAIGRPVTISHLHVRLRPPVQITTDDVVIANPPDWPKNDPPLASIGRLTVQANVWEYVRGHGVVLALIALDKPRVYAAETADGSANFRLSVSSGGGRPTIGDLRINDGDVHVVISRLSADFWAKIATQDEANAAKPIVDVEGTYAAQPVRARLTGGALLALRDTAHPWPVELTMATGPTRAALKGTLEDPLALKGANLTLQVNGPDLGLLEHLVGFPIPKTPAYQAVGKLNFEGFEKIRCEDFRGRLGNSDIAGIIAEQPSGKDENGKTKPVVTMDLRSDRVDLRDLRGFIGGESGRTDASNAPQQQAPVAESEASSKLLPDTPINVSRLNWADIHLRYRGAHILQERDIPLDNLDVTLDIVGGRITVHPVSFGVGKGRLLANVSLTPASGKNVRARADLHLQNLDVSRLMAATHTFDGAGSVSGIGAIDATGDSMASLLANGNGGMKMAMAGGDLSALLVDLSGLQFGNALLSALGFPKKTLVECLVSDLGLHQGILGSNVMVLQTAEAITTVDGNIDFRSGKIELALKTELRHFSIGSMPTRIAITGTLKNPSIRPVPELAARAGVGPGLAALLTPLELLPTVHFGTSEQEDARCAELMQQVRASAGGRPLPAPQKAGGDEKGVVPTR
ncbi:MAG: AsmA family protein [Acetobacteraceae bacterium]|nr:AsmA family protein [Acetobacteraceae bacterium]